MSVWLQLVGLRCHSGLGEHHHPPPIVLDNPRKVLDTAANLSLSAIAKNMRNHSNLLKRCAIGLALMAVLIRLICRISLYEESILKQYIEQESNNIQSPDLIFLL